MIILIIVFTLFFSTSSYSTQGTSHMDNQGQELSSNNTQEKRSEKRSQNEQKPEEKVEKEEKKIEKAEKVVKEEKIVKEEKKVERVQEKLENTQNEQKSEEKVKKVKKEKEEKYKNDLMGNMMTLKQKNYDKKEMTKMFPNKHLKQPNMWDKQRERVRSFAKKDMARKQMSYEKEKKEREKNENKKRIEKQKKGTKERIEEKDRLKANSTNDGPFLKTSKELKNMNDRNTDNENEEREEQEKKYKGELSPRDFVVKEGEAYTIRKAGPNGERRNPVNTIPRKKVVKGKTIDQGLLTREEINYFEDERNQISSFGDYLSFLRKRDARATLGWITGSDISELDFYLSTNLVDDEYNFPILELYTNYLVEHNLASRDNIRTVLPYYVRGMIYYGMYHMAHANTIERVLQGLRVSAVEDRDHALVRTIATLIDLTRATQHVINDRVMARGYNVLLHGTRDIARSFNLFAEGLSSVVEANIDSDFFRLVDESSVLFHDNYLAFSGLYELSHNFSQIMNLNLSPHAYNTVGDFPELISRYTTNVSFPRSVASASINRIAQEYLSSQDSPDRLPAIRRIISLTELELPEVPLPREVLNVNSERARYIPGRSNEMDDRPRITTYDWFDPPYDERWDWDTIYINLYHGSTGYPYAPGRDMDYITTTRLRLARTIEELRRILTLDINSMNIGTDNLMRMIEGLALDLGEIHGQMVMFFDSYLIPYLKLLFARQELLRNSYVQFFRHYNAIRPYLDPTEEENEEYRLAGANFSRYLRAISGVMGRFNLIFSNFMTYQVFGRMFLNTENSSNGQESRRYPRELLENVRVPEDGNFDINRNIEALRIIMSNDNYRRSLRSSVAFIVNFLSEINGRLLDMHSILESVILNYGHNIHFDTIGYADAFIQNSSYHNVVFADSPFLHYNDFIFLTVDDISITNNYLLALSLGGFPTLAAVRFGYGFLESSRAVSPDLFNLVNVIGGIGVSFYGNANNGIRPMLQVSNDIVSTNISTRELQLLDADIETLDLVQGALFDFLNMIQQQSNSAPQAIRNVRSIDVSSMFRAFVEQDSSRLTEISNRINTMFSSNRRNMIMQRNFNNNRPMLQNNYAVYQDDQLMQLNNLQQDFSNGQNNQLALVDNTQQGFNNQQNALQLAQFDLEQPEIGVNHENMLQRTAELEHIIEESSQELAQILENNSSRENIQQAIRRAITTGFSLSSTLQANSASAPFAVPLSQAPDNYYLDSIAESLRKDQQNDDLGNHNNDLDDNDDDNHDDNAGNGNDNGNCDINDNINGNNNDNHDANNNVENAANVDQNRQHRRHTTNRTREVADGEQQVNNGGDAAILGQVVSMATAGVSVTSLLVNDMIDRNARKNKPENGDDNAMDTSDKSASARSLKVMDMQYNRKKKTIVAVDSKDNAKLNLYLYSKEKHKYYINSLKTKNNSDVMVAYTYFNDDINNISNYEINSNYKKFINVSLSSSNRDFQSIDITAGASYTINNKPEKSKEDDKKPDVNIIIEYNYVLGGSDEQIKNNAEKENSNKLKTIKKGKFNIGSYISYGYYHFSSNNNFSTALADIFLSYKYDLLESLYIDTTLNNNLYINTIEDVFEIQPKIYLGNTKSFFIPDVYVAYNFITKNNLTINGKNVFKNNFEYGLSFNKVLLDKVAFGIDLSTTTNEIFKVSCGFGFEF